MSEIRIRRMQYRDVGQVAGIEKDVFARTADGKMRSLLFDAVEMLDTWLPLKEERP